MTVTLEEAKAQLEVLAEKAAKGEEILISRQGAANLRLMVAESPKRFLGSLEGQDFSIPDDFNTMLQAEIEEMFYGNPDKFADVERYLADHPGHALASLDPGRTEEREPDGQKTDQ